MTLRLDLGAVARELRYDLTDARDLCDRLGLLTGGAWHRQSDRGVIVRCPWHPDRSPSCSVRRADDGTIAVRCFSCSATGDALTFIASIHGLDVRRGFRAVLRIAAELANRWDLVAVLDDPGMPMPPPRPRRAPPTPTQVRDYPPVAEVAAVWGAAGYVSDDSEASAMSIGRGLVPEWIDDRALARVIAPLAALPRWARYQGDPWTATTHRLVLPAYDAAGAMRSLRAWRVVDTATPKRLPPSGYRASGLVLADASAAAMLVGDVEGLPSRLRVIIAEGEPDYLTWATTPSDADADAPIVLGIGGAGTWTAEIATRIPDGARVTLWTDHDAAGDSYAVEIAARLAGRCTVLRSRRSEAA